MPTDPIPPQQYEQQYPTGSDVWSQATVLQGGQTGPTGYTGPTGGYTGSVAEPRQGSRAGLLAIIFLAVVVLGGGGGYAAYYFVHKQTAPAPLNLADRQKAVVGDCMVNNGTNAAPDMHITGCTTANSYKVVKVARGDDVPRASNGKVDPNSAAATVCGSLDYKNFYVYWDENASDQNVVICLALNGNASTATGTG
jgi:hypothetical protein